MAAGIGQTARPRARRVGLLALLCSLALALAFVAPTAPAPRAHAAGRPNGAGLVIRHGDGRVLYIYVEFTEPSISGLDLLTRSQIALTLAQYGGLGAAVCAIQGEGCPADNCFCKSYGNPSYYWHYYHLDASGNWAPTSVGPSSRTIHDGDVDGWSWTAGPSGLPKVTIDEIAMMNGVDRSAPTPTPTAAPTRPPARPTPTPTPRPAAPTATATQAVTREPTATVAIATRPAPTATATRGPVAQAPPSATTTATGPSSPAASSPEALASATPPIVARGVEVNPTTGTRPLNLTAGRQERGRPSYLPFAAMLAALLGLGAAAIAARRLRRPGP